MSETIVADQSITRKPKAFDKRIHEIDLIRGFLIALVIFDHIMCWLNIYTESWYFAGMQQFKVAYQIFNYYWDSNERGIVREIALFGFVFISGVSTAFSKNNWIRAGEMLAFAFVLTGGSIIANEFLSKTLNACLRIDFNIIAVLAWSTLFYCFASGKTWRSIVAGMLLCLLLSWYLIPELNTYNEAHHLNMDFPAIFDPWKQHVYADWMPLFPYISYFFMGALFSYFFYAPTKQSLIKRKGNWERPICFMGRHSLLIYIGHQAILIPIFLLINALVVK